MKTFTLSIILLVVASSLYAQQAAPFVPPPLAPAAPTVQQQQTVLEQLFHGTLPEAESIYTSCDTCYKGFDRSESYSRRFEVGILFGGGIVISNCIVPNSRIG